MGEELGFLDLLLISDLFSKVLNRGLECAIQVLLLQLKLLVNLLEELNLLLKLFLQAIYLLDRLGLFSVKPIDLQVIGLLKLLPNPLMLKFGVSVKLLLKLA